MSEGQAVGKKGYSVSGRHGGFFMVVPFNRNWRT